MSPFEYLGYLRSGCIANVFWCLCSRSNAVGLPGPTFSSEKIKKELGMTFLDFNTMLQDQVRTMMDLQLIS
jgi:hypothetical protein